MDIYKKFEESEKRAETAKLVLTARIMTMKNDYNISMSKALLNDFYGMDYDGVDLTDPENIFYFDKYLFKNGIAFYDYDFFTNMLFTSE